MLFDACSSYNSVMFIFYCLLQLSSISHPPYDLNTMATAADRALLCILSKDALIVLCNVDVIFCFVYELRNSLRLNLVLMWPTLITVCFVVDLCRIQIFAAHFWHSSLTCIKYFSCYSTGIFRPLLNVICSVNFVITTPPVMLPVVLCISGVVEAKEHFAMNLHTNIVAALPAGRMPVPACFQTSAASYIRTALFWTITQRVVVIPYRRFGTTYRSHLQASRISTPNMNNR